MQNPRNIILVGFMASGKSAVGSVIADRLGWTLVDTDDRIVSSLGKSVSEIFAESGEEYFREKEEEVIRKLCEESGLVISAGGGAFMSQRNRDLMLSTGRVVFLNARPDTLFQRILNDERKGAPKRPLLSGDLSLDRLTQLLCTRIEYYKMASHHVDTDDMSPEQIADSLLTLYSE